MKSNRLTVGISAVFDPAVTPHARTFLRALGVARNHIPALAAVRFVYADDAACPTQAQAVAERFVAEGVDLVIGHFSSDAALAAVGTYAKANVALLTPAATATAVTASPAGFQICPNDTELAGQLLSFCVQRGWIRLRVRSDDSAHGQALAKAIREAAATCNVRLSDTDIGAEAVVFAGRLAPSGAFVAQHVASTPHLPLILTDDAVSPAFPGQAGLKAPVLAVGFRPATAYPEARLVCHQHHLLFGSPPETYFLESYAAFQILAALASAAPDRDVIDTLAGGRFETVLGPIRFENGRAGGQRHALWSLGPHGFAVLTDDLRDVTPLSQPVAATFPAYADQRISS